MTAFTFADAQPVPTSGPGRQASPNPFTEVIAAIALQTDKKTGKPIAKMFELQTSKESDATEVNRVKRQFSEAGAANEPAVTVRSHFEQVGETKTANKYKVTFWTQKRQERPRTATTDQATAASTETATTDQATAASTETATTE